VRLLVIAVPGVVERAFGIPGLWDWQIEALACPGVLEGERNLVYSAPTSGGKTLVAEVLMLFRLNQYARAGAALRPRKVLFVLPFKAVVSEKVRDLQVSCRCTQ
jgi:replicative superfamily II helicase